MTQKDILETVLAEIKHIKTHMPNGELKQLAQDFEKIKEDLSDLKLKLLNPEDGVIVNTNKNEYTIYMERIKTRAKQADQIRHTVKEINSLKRELREIKNLLREVINNGS